MGYAPLVGTSAELTDGLHIGTYFQSVKCRGSPDSLDLVLVKNRHSKDVYLACAVSPRLLGGLIPRSARLFGGLRVVSLRSPTLG